LTLALNELCTNAVKYGALSNQAGRVSIAWSADGGHLTLLWVESGGPTVNTPDRKNFGARLIEQALPRQLGGTGQMTFAPTGLRFELVLPMELLCPVTEISLQPEAALHA
jgi:two-component sensor histidine kinase